LGASLLVETLPKIAAGLQPVPQADDGVTYASKLSNEERVIDWTGSAQSIDRVIRCFSPRPGARTKTSGKWLKLIEGIVIERDATAVPGTVLAVEDGLDIACGDDSAYRVLMLQPEGKKAMAAADYLRGAALKPGVLLTW